MASINSGYNRKCKDGQGGVSNIWLTPYVKYSRSQIETSGNILLSFPESVLFEFVSLQNPAPQETMETDAGGKYYNQSISMTFLGSDLAEMQKLLKKDYRIIFKDRNGLYRIFGLFNGMEAGKIDYSTGGGKSDLNGFKIDFTGKEENGSYFINDFLIFENYLLQEDGFYLLQENGFKILL